MRATVTGISRNPSKYGGHFFYMFFKVETPEGHENMRSCLDPKMGNFKRWEGLVKRAEEGEVFVLDNLNKKGNMVDADSHPKEIKE